jgi:hypothetical protein
MGIVDRGGNPMPGPLPKENKLRQRRNREVSAKTLKDKGPALVKGVGKTAKIPELPKRRRKWRPETIAWWNDLWKSPMAVEFIESDLHQLYLLADLIDEYWRIPARELGKKKELANEIRLQRQCFGLTPIDRRRLQWEIERGESANAKGEKRRNSRKKTKTHKVDPRTVLDSRN